MSLIMFESDPTGANIAITSIISDKLAAFRAECMSGGEVVCDWATLENRLNDHTVSVLWWELIDGERRSIAEMAIKNTFLHQIHKKRGGKSNCEGGEGDWDPIDCGYNALIRYLKFNNALFSGSDSCYWYWDMKDVCYRPDHSYRLPCYMVFCGTMGPGFGHYMCAIQINQEINSLNGWTVFQYSNFNIQPGNWQMPTDQYDLYIKIYSLEKFALCGGQTWTDEVITRFDL